MHLTPVPPLKPQPARHLGSRMGEYIGQVTRRKPCGGCKKVESFVDNADKLAQALLAKATAVLSGKAWSRPSRKHQGDA